MMKNQDIIRNYSEIYLKSQKAFHASFVVVLRGPALEAPPSPGRRSRRRCRGALAEPIGPVLPNDGGQGRLRLAALDRYGPLLLGVAGTPAAIYVHAVAVGAPSRLLRFLRNSSAATHFLLAIVEAIDGAGKFPADEATLST